jgi:HEAT repeat protein
MVLCGSPAVRVEAQDRPAPDRAGSPIEGLRAKDVEVRRNAASQVRNSNTDLQREALPAMIDLLAKEKDGQVRLAVLDTMIGLGPDAAAAVPALVQTLRSDYGGQRLEESHQDYRAAFALSAIGRPAVDGLRGLLKERKESVRAEAVMGLGRIGADAEAAVPDLIPLLGDKAERISREASLALGRIGMSAIDPLIVASADQDVIVRARALEGLGGLSRPDDRVRAAVLRSVQDRVPEVRAASLKLLARLGLPEEALLPIARESLRDRDERVRLAVVNMLIERPTLLLRMAPELEALLSADEEGVAHHAAFLLRKIGPGAAPILIGALRLEKSRIDPIAGALAQIGRPAVGLLMEAVKAPEPRVRRGAALALGQIRPLAPGTVPKLTAGLDAPEPEVRAAFLTAIGDLGPRAAESVPAVRVLLKDESPEIRVQAIEVLSHSAPRDERLLGDLMDRLDDPDTRVQRQAIDTIRSLGPLGRKALTIAIGKLDSEDTDVRYAAAQLVESHGPGAAEAIPALGSLLGDPTPRIRAIAAQTLGKLGQAARPAFDRLTPLLGDEHVEVREAAASTIGSLELDAETIRPHLARALRDERTEVRRAATRAIQRLGPQGAIFIPDIIAMASSRENARSVDRLLRTFERTGPDVRSLPELVKQLEHEQVAVRLLAIKFLGLAGRSARDVLPALERIGEDPSAEIRRQVKAACEQIRNDAESGRPKDRAPGGGATE